MSLLPFIVFIYIFSSSFSVILAEDLSILLIFQKQPTFGFVDSVFLPYFSLHCHVYDLLPANFGLVYFSFYSFLSCKVRFGEGFVFFLLCRDL